MAEGGIGVLGRYKLVLGAAVISLAGVAVALVSTPPRPSVSPTVRQTIAPGAVWPEGFVVRPGDRAVGVGQLVARNGEATLLCTGLDGLLDKAGAQYRCSQLSVEVRGVDLPTIGQVRKLAGASIIDDVVLHGIWNGQSLTVDAVGGVAVRLPASPSLSCEFEVPGAASEDPWAGDTEAAYQRLKAEVDANPTAYAGIWVANGPQRAIVVATTQDLVSTGVALRRLFPFALCVVRVRFSMAELSSVAENLPRPAGAWWRVEIDVSRNRALVRVPVLTDEVVRALVDQPAVEVLPILMLEP